MHVPNRVRKNVMFVGVGENGRFVPKATTFIVSCNLGGKRFDHFVTAEHVISGLRAKNYDKPLIRLNRADGQGAVSMPINYDAWYYHPDDANPTDVAVAPANLDRSFYEFTHAPLDTFATKDVIDKERFGAGDEIFICGLFRQHHGQNRNIPIVRTGNIAAMPEEPIHTKYCGNTEAYLVEARSISGLSGSPVFVPNPPMRVVDDEMRVLPEKGLTYYFLGLMHGHFDVQNINEDADTNGSINTGIGIVIPAQKIWDTIMQPELADKREAIIKKLQKEGATADLDGAVKPEPPTKGENPDHREAFNRLLDAAVKGPKPD